ncbi:MAG TPA: hypothetical protein VMT24_19880 [Aggregatilineaceae bacterium]|nr:hypothetical protein [Aggregatilineaceae bacterium]
MGADRSFPDEPIKPGDIGLPADYDPRYIPTGDDLQRAAIQALHRETSFVVLNRDTPQAIVNRLGEITEVVLAASQVPGEHRAKAVRLGLALELDYWLARGNLDDWPDLIVPLLKASLEIGDHELQSRIYRAWSIYLFVSRDRRKAAQALVAALDYASDARRDDLKLLIRAERLNLKVPEMSLDEARDEANALLAEARRLSYAYIQGRAYFSLARAYQFAALPKETFQYAQQALMVFVQWDVIGLAGECIGAMLNSLYYRDARLDVYASRLRAYLETLGQSSASPFFQAVACYNQGFSLYHRADYDQSRAYVLKAWVRYRALRYRESLERVKHMLGLVQIKRHRWGIAERHLRAALAYYEQAGQAVYAAHARHALAFIPYEQGDFARALGALEAVLVHARSLPERAAREWLVQLVASDIEDARQKLSGPPRPQIS